MSALMIVFKDEQGKVQNVPFVYKDGELLEALERMAVFLNERGQGDEFWKGVAIDRQNLILKQKVEIKDLEKRLAELTEWASYQLEEAAAT